jgi:hypothetical protein
MTKMVFVLHKDRRMFDLTRHSEIYSQSQCPSESSSFGIEAK